MKRTYYFGELAGRQVTLATPKTKPLTVALLVVVPGIPEAHALLVNGFETEKQARSFAAKEGFVDASCRYIPISTKRP